MSKSELVKKYSEGDLTVIWKPGLCIHSENCWRNLPDVFKPKDKPWIQLSGCDKARVIAQVNACPSGALSYATHTEISGSDVQNIEDDQVRVEIIADGPLAIHSNCSVSHPNGTIEQKSNKVFFCRCGGSENKPYCDGSHRKLGFKG